MKYVTQNCPKWKIEELEATESKDQRLYFEEKEERAIEKQKIENKKRLNPEEASDKVVKTNSLIQKKTLMANSKFKKENKDIQNRHIRMSQSDPILSDKCTFQNLLPLCR